jgi:DNA-binding MarR family transcriptional regulator
MDWIKYAWLKRGKRRQVTLEAFRKSTAPLSVNDVHERTKVALSQASATVSELEQKNLIHCLNPQDKIGKLYQITPEGKELLEGLNGSKKT